MGLQDGDYNRAGGGDGGGGDYGEGGGFKRAMRRMFVEGDNFFGWAIPIYRLAGITVKIHILYLVYLALKFIGPVDPGSAGFWFTAFFWGCGFIFVLLHEYGHCFACRAVGGEAEEIIMWPLGGLAMCRPPHDWKANLITTVCGPAVNLVLAAIFGGAMLALGSGWGAVFFDLREMWAGIRSPWFDANWKVLLYAAYAWNLYNFLFNVFLPMFPMDGGRIVQELLWARIGYKRATAFATNLGLLLAVVVGVYALNAKSNILFSIALFGGITCFMQRRALAFVADEPAWAHDTDRGPRGFDGPSVPSASRGTAAQDKAYQAALKRQERERQVQAEVDRILDKIRDHGMQSLTRGEKAILKEATERTRGMG